MLSVNKRTAPYAALVLRIALGSIMIFNGLSDERAFPVPAGLHIPEGLRLAMEVLPVIEIAFGTLLLLGIKTRAVALVIIPVLLGAQSIDAHAARSTMPSSSAWQYTFMLSAACLAQALLGAGAWRLRLTANPRRIQTQRALVEVGRRSESGIQVRAARADDLPVIARILNEVSWLEHLDSEPASVTLVRLRSHLQISQADDSHTVLCAEAPKRGVVGYLQVHWMASLCSPAVEGFVSDLFVSEDSRGCGIASRLLDVAMELARIRGACRLSLNNGRNWESYRLGFYSRHGWTERENFANFVYWLDTHGP